MGVTLLLHYSSIDGFPILLFHPSTVLYCILLYRTVHAYIEIVSTPPSLPRPDLQTSVLPLVCSRATRWRIDWSLCWTGDCATCRLSMYVLFLQRADSTPAEEILLVGKWTEKGTPGVYLVFFFCLGQVSNTKYTIVRLGCIGSKFGRNRMIHCFRTLFFLSSCTPRMESDAASPGRNKEIHDRIFAANHHDQNLALRGERPYT